MENTINNILIGCLAGVQTTIIALRVFDQTTISWSYILAPIWLSILWVAISWVFHIALLWLNPKI